MCILSHKIWQEKVPGSGSSISEISTQEDSTGWSHGDLNRYPYNDWSAGLLLELVLSMNECALIPSSLSLSRLHSLLTNSLQIKIKQQSVISSQHVQIYFIVTWSSALRKKLNIQFQIVIKFSISADQAPVSMSMYRIVLK